MVEACPGPAVRHLGPIAPQCPSERLYPHLERKTALPQHADVVGEPVPAGWEGVHIFNIRDKANPKLVGSVETECGSHTATLVKDKNRLIVYSNAAAADRFLPFSDRLVVPGHQATH